MPLQSYIILHFACYLALLQDVICMERSACNKNVSKRLNVSIFNIHHVHQRRFWSVLVDTRVPETVYRFSPTDFAGRNLSRLVK